MPSKATSKAKGRPKAKTKRVPAKTTSGPAKAKVMPWLSTAISEGWSIAKLSEKAGVSENTAHKYLREERARLEERAGELVGNLAEEATREARYVRQEQIRQARRYQALGEKALQSLEAKAESGELSVRDFETLVKAQGKAWENIKEVSGHGFLERMQLIQAKGEAQGRGIAQALDATAADLSQAITIEAEILPE